MQSIVNLDEKRVKLINETWQDVNASFGRIFSTLLPGATAKLVPTESGDIEDGLEVKVAFASVWKDSLSELSGGQRSLIALSLIFALLKFRPAPLYILDEVRHSRLPFAPPSATARLGVATARRFGQNMCPAWKTRQLQVGGVIKQVCNVRGGACRWTPHST